MCSLPRPCPPESAFSTYPYNNAVSTAQTQRSHSYCRYSVGMAIPVYAHAEEFAGHVLSDDECQVMAAESNKLQFTLNGELVEVENPDPQQLLVHWLRESGHTGTKVSASKLIYC